MNREEVRAKITSFLGDGPFAIADILDFVRGEVSLEALLERLNELRVDGRVEYRLGTGDGRSRRVVGHELAQVLDRYRALDAANALYLPDPIDLYVELRPIAQPSRSWRLTVTESPARAICYAQTRDEAEIRLWEWAGHFGRSVNLQTCAAEAIGATEAPSGLLWTGPGVRVTCSWTTSKGSDAAN